MSRNVDVNYIYNQQNKQKYKAETRLEPDIPLMM